MIWNRHGKSLSLRTRVGMEKLGNHPSTAWATGKPTPPRMAEIAGAGDPFYRPSAEWVVRRLGPRCSRLELDGVKGDLTVLLGVMGAETANAHGRSGDAGAILGYLRGREEGWLPAAAKAMAGALRANWIDWYSGAGDAPAP
jgi:hypothetical protein